MKHLVFALVFVIGVILAGCDRKKPETDELLLYCGAGIRPPAEELIAAFFAETGIKVLPDYAGSETLLSKIKISRRGDLYMPGDRHYVEQADKAGMILSHNLVSYWVPTILVQKGNPKGIRDLEDLLKPGLKVGFGDPNACAIGRITWQILVKGGISREDLESNLTYQSMTVNELGMQIQARSLDAVIVWDAMARYYSQHGDQVSIASEKNIVSTVDVGVLKFTKNKKLAEKFVAFLTSKSGREIFRKHNYTVDPPN